MLPVILETPARRETPVTLVRLAHRARSARTVQQAIPVTPVTAAPRDQQVLTAVTVTRDKPAIQARRATRGLRAA